MLGTKTHQCSNTPEVACQYKDYNKYNHKKDNKQKIHIANLK